MAAEDLITSCARCAGPIVGRRRGALYCSERCKMARGEELKRGRAQRDPAYALRRRREAARRQRLCAANQTVNGSAIRRRVIRDATVERVERLKVWLLGAGRCGLCGGYVRLEEMDVDHIIPLSRQGEHSYANTQPAHPSCNRRKGARL